MDNPLLAMLQMAANGPPAGPPAAAPREHSMSPPAQLQPVSLDDLFKGMAPHGSRAASGSGPGMIPVPAMPMPIGPPSQTFAGSPAGGFSPSGPGLAVSPPAQHQAKLLGMLSLGGRAPLAATPVDSRPASGVPALDQRKNSLLNVLKSPATANVPLGEPIIHHPQTITPPGIHLGGVISSSGVISPPGVTGAISPAGAISAGVISPPLAANAAGAIPPPAATPLGGPKSMFDFVSPFDAFEAPKSRTFSNSSAAHSGVHSALGSGIATPADMAVSPAKSAVGVSPIGTVVTSPAPPVVNKDPTPATIPTPSAVSPVPASSPSMPAAPAVPSPVALAQVRSNSPAIRQVNTVRDQGRRPSGGSPPSKGKNDFGLPWLTAKVVKNIEGTGPLSLPPGPITVDVSKPGTEALANTPGTIQVTPTTIMKAENVAFHRGRTVASTPGWLAYSLSRGRIRIIDRTSGARKLIQLEATGPVIDLIASAETLAAVASDGAVTVFRIPASWIRDDPHCPIIFSMGPIDEELIPADKTLGDINHIEFVRRQGAANLSLAIGGTEGVVIVHPHDWSAAPEADAREVLTASKVLKTNGVVAAFCLNASHQAIGLLSSSGYFTLYSVVQLNRVWHRQLPASSTLPLSSVSFVETNILVGRGNDTQLDLVQITVEIAVLATITFVAPPPSPPVLHFAHASYSAEREILFVTPFARGSVYAFHYALKGQPPLRNVMKENAHVLAFDSMTEYPINAPVLSFVLGGSDDLELFYSTPAGINQASIDKAVLSVKPLPAPKQEKKSKKQKAAASAASAAAAVAALAPAPVAQAASAAATPAAAPVALPAAREISSDGAAPVHATVVAGITSDELAKALKKTEDKLSSSFKQVVANEIKAVSSRLDKDKDLAASVSSAITSHLDAHLAGIVQQELSRVPIEAQIRAAVSEHSSTIGRELERAIAPIVPRTIATVVQPAVERAARDAVEVVLVPAVMSATNRVYDQLANDLKTEMLQIRKDVNNDQGDALNATNAMLRSMATSISELQKQVAELSTQLQRARTPQPPHHHLASQHLASQHLASQSHHHQQLSPATPAGPPLPSPQQLEDTFLHVLQQSSSQAMLQLVASQSAHLDQILPLPPAKSPLPHAVLLPLIHRLSATLSELPPHHPAFQTTATWLRRAVELIDPRDPSIASYYPRAMPTVEHTLRALIDRFQGMGPDQLVAAHIGVLRQTLEVIESKSH